MTDVEILIGHVSARWRAMGLRTHPGTDLAHIRNFEKRYGVVVPDDLAAYFRAVDGMNDAEMDDAFIRFWPLAEVEPVAAELPRQGERSAYDGYYIFADYSIRAHDYAICLSGGSNSVIMVGGEKPIQIAPSFGAFLELYLNEAPALWGARELKGTGNTGRRPRKRLRAWLAAASVKLFTLLQASLHRMRTRR